MTHLTNFDSSLLNGTLIHYYVTCKREAWLYSRKISADQWDENIRMGKALADIKEEQLDDFPFSNLKFDKIGKERGHYLVTEYKKSMSNPKGAKMQLLFYMWQLKTSLKLKEINGKVISGRTVLFIEGSDEKNIIEVKEHGVSEQRIEMLLENFTKMENSNNELFKLLDGMVLEITDS